MAASWYLTLMLLFLFLELVFALPTASKKPHVVLLIADDLGYNDVSWHNKDVLMPNLDRLAREGVILNRSYAQPTCTPSRSALLTGRYPFRLGTQNGPFGDSQPVGLPTDFSLLPDHLRKIGYKTHLVGKWHLGFCRQSLIPINRGFDTHYGFLCGYENYFNHTSYLLTNGSFGGFDLRDNMKRQRSNRYSSYLFADRVSSLIRSHDPKTPMFLLYAFQAPHTPLQVPRRFYDMYPHVKDHRRRIYLGMVTALDEAVGRLVKDLKAANMYDNTFFVFSSDNGGKPPTAGASNFPLNGFKDTLWEGGVRVPAFIYSKNFVRKGRRVENGYVHITDWFPTIMDLAGGGFRSAKTDGLSHAKTILNGFPSQRHSMIVNIDELTNMSAVILGAWKLIIGMPIYERPYHAANKYYKITGRARAIKYRLFNIKEDPSETRNLASHYPLIRSLLSRLIRRQKPFIRPSLPTAGCPWSNPKLFRGYWSPGWCTDNNVCIKPKLHGVSQ